MACNKALGYTLVEDKTSVEYKATCKKTICDK